MQWSKYICIETKVNKLGKDFCSMPTIIGIEIGTRKKKKKQKNKKK